MNNSELTLDRHEQAQRLHQQIMTSGSLAAQNLFDMANALKDMRDGKLYKEMGYERFEDYCEGEVGMKRANAYRYISIAENLNSENVSSMRQIGMTKLALLASLSEDKQAEVAEAVDLESISVRELKEEINKLKGEKMVIENERHKLESKLAAEAASADELRESLSFAQKKVDKASAENARLEKENKELRERPVEVAVEDHTEEYERKLEKALEDEREKLGKEKKELEKDFRDEVHKMRKDYEARLKEMTAEFNARAAESKAANSVDGEKEQFKVFLVMAHDALARLIQAAERNATETYVNKVRDLLANAIQRTEDIECRE